MTAPSIIKALSCLLSLLSGFLNFPLVLATFGVQYRGTQFQLLLPHISNWS